MKCLLGETEKEASIFKREEAKDYLIEDRVHNVEVPLAITISTATGRERVYDLGSECYLDYVFKADSVECFRFLRDNIFARSVDDFDVMVKYFYPENYREIIIKADATRQMLRVGFEYTSACLDDETFVR